MAVFSSLRGVAALGVLALIGGNGDAFAEGVRAYREGRAKDALVAFLDAERTAGDAAAPALLFDLALAALASGDLRRAEVAVEKAATRGGPEFAGLRDFVLGNAAFVRCTRAELQASGPEAEPFAFDVAIGHAASALASWQAAATTRADWPEARRNVERALEKLAELKRLRAEAQQRQAKKKDKTKPKDPEPERKPDTEKGKDELATPKPQAPDEGATQVQTLLDRIVKRDLEKRDVRRSQQQVRSKLGEKDW